VPSKYHENSDICFSLVKIIVMPFVLSNVEVCSEQLNVE